MGVKASSAKASKAAATSKEWVPELGGKCEVFSKSSKKWFPADVKTMGWELDQEHEVHRTFTVSYKVSGEIFTKRVLADDISTVRCLAPGKREEFCLCGEVLVHSITRRRVRAEVKTCMMCATELNAGDHYFQCPKGNTEIHNGGYVRCWKCITDESKLYPIYMTKDMISEECRTTDGNVAQLVADRPFAKGSTCLVYLGVYTIPSKKGKACVIKKLRRTHPYCDEQWKADMLCVTKAHELVTAWNQAAIVPKPFEMIVPHIGRRGGGGLSNELSTLLLSLLLFAEISKDDTKKVFEALKRGSLLGVTQDVGDEEIARGECVVYEDFLVGHFAKWNSNGGWCSPRSARLSVQAFCHWTFHYSKGQCLFCDAQGIRREDRYQLTDPAICSTVEAQYGDTDLGPNGMYAWFLTHRCGDYCSKAWLKPTQAQLESVPAEYRKLSAAPGTRSMLTDFASRRVATFTRESVAAVLSTAEEETKEEISDESIITEMTE